MKKQKESNAGRIFHVMILEDSATDADLMEYELEEAGLRFAARRAMTEDEFLRGLDEDCPDVILSDYDMPRYTGALALAEAKKRYPEVPFILVTGALDKDQAGDLLVRGADGYVSKHQLGRLAVAVKKVLGIDGNGPLSSG